MKNPVKLSFALLLVASSVSFANWTFDLGNNSKGTATDSQVAKAKSELAACWNANPPPEAGECGWYHQAVKQCGIKVQYDYSDEWIAHKIAHGISTSGLLGSVSAVIRDACQYNAEFPAALKKKVSGVRFVLDLKKLPGCPGGDLSKPALFELKNKVLVVTTGDCNTDLSEPVRGWLKENI